MSSPDPTKIRVPCSHCGRRLLIPVERAGSIIRCKCGASLTVPMPDSSENAGPDMAICEAARELPQHHESAVLPSNASRASRLLKAVVITCATVVIVATGVVIARRASQNRIQPVSIAAETETPSEVFDAERHVADGRNKNAAEDKDSVPDSQAEITPPQRGKVTGAPHPDGVHASNKPSEGKPKPEVTYRGKPLSDWIGALQDKDVSIRRQAAAALGAIGPESKNAIPFLIEAMQDRDMDFRMIVAETLSKIGPEARQAVPQLLEALTDESEGVSMAAFRSLWELA